MTSPWRASMSKIRRRREGDDLHGAAAVGAEQWVDLVDAFDEHGPASAAARVEAGGFRRVARAVVTVRLCVWFGDGLFGAVAAGFVGVMAAVADEVFALVGNVLGEFGKEVQRFEDLEVAGDAAEEGSGGEAERAAATQ